MAEVTESQEQRSFEKEAGHATSAARFAREAGPVRPAVTARVGGEREHAPASTIVRLDQVTVRYGGEPAVRDIDLDVQENRITALIGPSGCGKSTLIRCLNRMNDLIPSATVEGRVLYHGQDLYAPQVTRSRCASGSGWCSRSRTRSRSRSTTTSPSARGCSA